MHVLNTRTLPIDTPLVLVSDYRGKSNWSLLFVWKCGGKLINILHLQKEKKDKWQEGEDFIPPSCRILRLSIRAACH